MVVCLVQWQWRLPPHQRCELQPEHRPVHWLSPKLGVAPAREIADLTSLPCGDDDPEVSLRLGLRQFPSICTHALYTCAAIMPRVSPPALWRPSFSKFSRLHSRPPRGGIWTRSPKGG